MYDNALRTIKELSKFTKLRRYALFFLDFYCRHGALLTINILKLYAMAIIPRRSALSMSCLSRDATVETASLHLFIYWSLIRRIFREMLGQHY